MQNSAGYLLGKLFAQLEREGAVQTRDYQQASVNPQAIIPAFARLAEMGKSDTIIGVMNEIPVDVFDKNVMSPSDQADFPLGYYHTKARALKTEPDEEESYTAQLLVRLEPSLKKWVIDHGGSKLVRSLLRAERDRQ